MTGFLFHLFRFYFTIRIQKYDFVLFSIKVLDIISVDEICFLEIIFFNLFFDFGINEFNENFIYKYK